MRFNLWLAIALAAAIFLALFAFRLFVEPPEASPAYVSSGRLSQSFDFTKNNYATAQKLQGPGQPVGDSQKYEKIATLTELTQDFEADRRRVGDLIAKQQ